MANDRASSVNAKNAVKRGIPPAASRAIKDNPQKMKLALALGFKTRLSKRRTAMCTKNTGRSLLMKKSMTGWRKSALNKSGRNCDHEMARTIAAKQSHPFNFFIQ